jgi:peptidoglycan/xylan/chitin deacetylase (PgdA/CDA1 family)
VKAALLAGIRRFDERNASRYLRLAGDRPSLIVVLFHSLFADAREAETGPIAPQQAITVGHFRELIRYFLERDHDFIAPPDVLRGLDPTRRHVMLTFDDGYFNNIRALPVLTELRVPATFFISVGHVLEQKRFWWDALHREGSNAEIPAAELRSMKAALKRMTTAAAEDRIVARFGRRALDPVSDMDRPLSRDELVRLAAHPWAHIGNHTRDHAILTNYASEDARTQIADCQSELARLLGEAPVAISYPNGNHSPETLRLAAEEGLQLGITAVTHKNALPLPESPLGQMSLGRFVPYGARSIARQCDLFRADIGLYAPVKRRFDARKWR